MLVARVLREGGPGWPEGHLPFRGRARALLRRAGGSPPSRHRSGAGAGARAHGGARGKARTWGPRSRRRAFRLMRSARKTHLIPEEMLERTRQRYGSADYVAAEGVMRQVLVRLLSENYEDQISRLGCPVELVWGDDDTEAPLSIARAVHGAIPGSILTVSARRGAHEPRRAFQSFSVKRSTVHSRLPSSRAC